MRNYRPWWLEGALSFAYLAKVGVIGQIVRNTNVNVLLLTVLLSRTKCNWRAPRLMMPFALFRDMALVGKRH